MTPEFKKWVAERSDIEAYAAELLIRAFVEEVEGRAECWDGLPEVKIHNAFTELKREFFGEKE